MSEKIKEEYYFIKTRVFVRNLRAFLIIGFFSLISFYLIYFNNNEFFAFAIMVTGILLALIYNERSIDNLVSKLPYTEYNGEKLYLVSGDPGETLVTVNLKPKIIITDSTLKLLSEEEQKSVIEHEISHIKLKHNIISLLYTVITLGLAVTGHMLVAFPSLLFGHYAVNNGLAGLLVFFQTLLSSIIYMALAFIVTNNVSLKEADWYAVKNVEKEAYLKVLNKQIEEGVFSKIEDKQTHSKLSSLLTSLDKYFYEKFITIEDRINIIEKGSYEPFSYRETIKSLFPVIFLMSFYASTLITYRLYDSLVKFTIVFPVIFNLIMALSLIALLIAFSSLIYFILTKLSIKEYLARTSIIAYYVITLLFILFPGIIESIIINLVAFTAAVLISSSEGRLRRAIIGWSLIYVITTLTELKFLTLLKL